MTVPGKWLFLTTSLFIAHSAWGQLTETTNLFPRKKLTSARWIQYRMGTLAMQTFVNQVPAKKLIGDLAFIYICVLLCSTHHYIHTNIHTSFCVDVNAACCIYFIFVRANHSFMNGITLQLSFWSVFGNYHLCIIIYYYTYHNVFISYNIIYVK